MNQLKYTIISFCILSFFSTTVFSNSINFCLKNIKVEKKIFIKPANLESSCHTDIDDKTKEHICLKCDCCLIVLANFHDVMFDYSFINSELGEFFLFNDSLNRKINDPPPKLVS